MATTALATQEASPRLVARYLASLKPVLSNATDARNVWVRYLGELARRDDMGKVHAEAVQFALSRGQQFHDARRAISQLHVPAGYEPMHQAVDGWLQGLLTSCEMLVRSHPPLGRDTLDRIQDVLREAAAKADRFNNQRTAAVQSILDAQSPIPAKAKRMVASKKEMRALMVALLAALLLVGGAAFALNSLAASPAPTRTPVAAAKPGGAGSGIERRVFPQPEVLGRLRQEVTNRKLAFQEVDVKLVPPDRVVVTGRIQGPTSLVPVETELQVGATEDGKPTVSAKRLSAVGVEVPSGAFDALNKRVEEANKTLPEQVTPGQNVKRVFVEDNAIVVELTGGAAGAPASPPPAGAPAPKPGG